MIAPRFGRAETQQTARKMARGLMSQLPVKNCWTLAEQAGDETSDAMQHLLARAVWDEDAVRDDLRRYVVDHLGAVGVILVVDESGDLKREPNADIGI
ncbi:transposase [Nocardia brasiliensis]|uniref:transposase n=1 Tax=Nocardia brasiliensis TaxID=37326 RepID=UPI00366E6A5E